MPQVYMAYPYTGLSFNVGEEVELRATIDATGLLDTYDAYGLEFYVNGESVGKGSVNKNWEATFDYTFEETGSCSIRARLVNDSSGAYLGYQSGTVSVTIKVTSRTFYGKVILNGNGGTYYADGVNNKTTTYPGSGKSTGSSATFDIAFADPGFKRDGYILLGFDESKNASNPDYGVRGEYEFTSESTDEDDPDSVTLYAIWSVVSQAHPGEWVWRTTIKSGTSVQPLERQKDGTYHVAYMPYREWNDFVDHVLKIADYIGVTVNGDTSLMYAAPNTRMMANTANAVRLIIYAMGPEKNVPNPVDPGDPITADFFIKLAESLNSIK